MLSFYIKPIIRSFWSQKNSFIINVIGLTLGFTSCILLGLWVIDELKVNTFQGEKKFYQLITNYEVNSNIHTIKSSSYPIFQTFDKKIPEIESVTILSSFIEKHKLIAKNKRIDAIGRAVSSNFFRTFKRKILYGNANELLNNPLSIILSKSTAIRLWGDKWKEKINTEIINIDDWKEVEVTGVFEDFPNHSTISFDYCTLISPVENDNVGNYNYEIFLKLNTNSSIQSVQNKINSLIRNLTKSTTFLQSFNDIYLYSDYKNGKINGGRIEYVRLFSVASVLILIMAFINFMNLFTAGAFAKTKEIGLKILFSGSRNTIYLSLIIEAFIILIFSLILSIIFLVITLPYINSIIEDNIRLPFESISFWVFLILLIIGSALIIGSYPSFLITSFDPIKILKSNNSFKIGGVGLRKVFFLFQFIISFFLIFYAFGVKNQILFLKNKNLGYNKENMLCKKLSKNEIDKIDLIKNDILSQTDFNGVTSCSNSLQNGSPMVGGIIWPNMPVERNQKLGVIYTDTNFIKTMKLKLKEGNFPLKSPSGRVSVIINESATEIMGGNNNILNSIIKVWGVEAEVTGICKNFHFNSLYSPLEPLIIVNLPQESEFLFTRVKEGKKEDALAFFKKLNSTYNAGEDFEYYWLDDNLNNLYKNETKVGIISIMFSILSLIISSLGLFGLSSFTLQQKEKELSIRKVLGASSMKLILLLFKDFYLLIGIAIIIAIPTAFYLLENWLSGFYYRIQLSILTFIIPIVLMSSVTLITIIGHCIKIFLVNPATILRNE